MVVFDRFHQTPAPFPGWGPHDKDWTGNDLSAAAEVALGPAAARAACCKFAREHQGGFGRYDSDRLRYSSQGGGHILEIAHWEKKGNEDRGDWHKKEA